MKTDELIALLASGEGAIKTSAPSLVWRRLGLALLAGGAGAVALTWLWLGLNPQLQAYLGLRMHWMKVAFTVALLLAAMAAAARLVRPGVAVAWVWAAIAAPVLIMWAMAGIVMMSADPVRRTELWMGQTWASCPINIAVLALPALVAALIAIKGLAPTRLRLAGAVAGLLAGATGAAAYTLHCPELTAPFLAIWYVLGMLIPVIAGTLLGPRVLCW